MRTVTRRVTRGALALSAGALPLFATTPPADAATNDDYKCVDHPAIHCALAQVTCYGRHCDYWAYAEGNHGTPANGLVLLFTAYGPGNVVLDQKFRVCAYQEYCDLSYSTTLTGGGLTGTCAQVWIAGQPSEPASTCAFLSVK